MKRSFISSRATFETEEWHLALFFIKQRISVEWEEGF
jgi:hypothetical protein